MSTDRQTNEVDFNAMRARLRGDWHRPGYHFVAPANWMNDPNGLIQWQGVYHMFYQYNPDGPLHANIHWGHAVSTDLVHWEDWPVALAPTPNSPDAHGCYSGCAVDNNGVPTFIYSGNRRLSETDPTIREQRTCIATSADGLRTWTKDPGNPVIPDVPPGMALVQYRDPSAWREADTWYQVTGSGFRDVGGTALLYRSDDLRHWEYLHPLHVGDVHRTEPFRTGIMWECPQFFALDGTHILIISTWDDGPKQTAYFAGTYAGLRFTPWREGLLDLGWSFFAPQAFCDDIGRRVMFGWLREERERDALVAAGWAGAMSLPRVLTAGADGTLMQRPAPELQSLRGAHVHHDDITTTDEVQDVLGGLQGGRMEIIAQFRSVDAERFGLSVFRAPDGSEETRIIYDCARQQLLVDRTRSRADTVQERPVVGGACPLGTEGELRLHVFLDGSVIELFAQDDSVCLTTRVYPARADSTGVALVAEGGRAVARSLDFWEMASVW